MTLVKVNKDGVIIDNPILIDIDKVNEIKKSHDNKNLIFIKDKIELFKSREVRHSTQIDPYEKIFSKMTKKKLIQLIYDLKEENYNLKKEIDSRDEEFRRLVLAHKIRE